MDGTHGTYGMDGTQVTCRIIWTYRTCGTIRTHGMDGTHGTCGTIRTLGTCGRTWTLAVRCIYLSFYIRNSVFAPSLKPPFDSSYS